MVGGIAAAVEKVIFSMEIVDAGEKNQYNDRVIPNREDLNLREKG